MLEFKLIEITNFYFDRFLFFISSKNIISVKIIVFFFIYLGLPTFLTNIGFCLTLMVIRNLLSLYDYCMLGF